MLIFKFVPTADAISSGRVAEKTRVEFHLLQPKDYFEGFGGSRHALRVEKTASIISRFYSPAAGVSDREVCAKDVGTWDWIRRLMANPNFVQTLEPSLEEDA